MMRMRLEEMRHLATANSLAIFPHSSVRIIFKSSNMQIATRRLILLKSSNMQIVQLTRRLIVHTLAHIPWSTHCETL